MPVIELRTVIRAPRERVFDLARSVDAHQASAAGTDERAVAGVTTGLVGLNDTITWEARHLGVRQRLTVRISQFERPTHFRDEMVSGAFKRFVHDHMFEESAEGTVMFERFDFDAPLGVLGSVANSVFLTAYMRRFLSRRNAVLKELAETEGWRRFLGEA